MYCISDEQIDFILNDIRRNGVETEDLQLNLLDHICCIIEQNLDAEDDFEDFYRKTIIKFYKRNLREIEDEASMLLIFKNYYAMKKLMMVSGLVTVTGFVLGAFFKIMYWNGTALLLIPSILVFCFIFVPLLFIIKTKEMSNSREKVVLTIGTISGMLYCISILFNVQHWEGARLIWLTTLCISCFILLPLFFFNGIRKHETRLNTIITTIILIGVLGMQFTMTSWMPYSQVYERSLSQTYQAK